MPTIRIDDEVYEWLQKMARPFEDTPNSVLRRVAELDDTSEKEEKMEIRLIRGTKSHGEKTSQSEFRKPILVVLQKYGGSGSRMQVLKEVEKILGDKLTAYDKSDISSGSIRWQKSAEWEVRLMREQGLLKSVSETPTGVWALTSKGIAVVEAT